MTPPSTMTAPENGVDQANASDWRRQVLFRRFSDLRDLRSGWMDGQGAALHRPGLDAVASRMIAHYPDELVLPGIIPTPEGNLLLEWDLTGSPSLDIHLDNMQAHFHAFSAGGDDVVRDFELSSAAEWGRFFAFLHEIADEQSVGQASGR